MIGIKQKYQVLSFQTEQTVNRKKSGFRAALVFGLPFKQGAGVIICMA